MMIKETHQIEQYETTCSTHKESTEGIVNSFLPKFCTGDSITFS